MEWPCWIDECVLQIRLMHRLARLASIRNSSEASCIPGADTVASSETIRSALEEVCRNVSWHPSLRSRLKTWIRLCDDVTEPAPRSAVRAPPSPLVRDLRADFRSHAIRQFAAWVEQSERSGREVGHSLDHFFERLLSPESLFGESPTDSPRAEFAEDDSDAWQISPLTIPPEQRVRNWVEWVRLMVSLREVQLPAGPSAEAAGAEQRTPRRSALSVVTRVFRSKPASLEGDTGETMEARSVPLLSWWIGTVEDGPGETWPPFIAWNLASFLVRFVDPSAWESVALAAERFLTPGPGESSANILSAETTAFLGFLAEIVDPYAARYPFPFEAAEDIFNELLRSRGGMSVRIESCPPDAGSAAVDEDSGAWDRLHVTSGPFGAEQIALVCVPAANNSRKSAVRTMLSRSLPQPTVIRKGRWRDPMPESADELLNAIGRNLAEFAEADPWLEHQLREFMKELAATSSIDGWLEPGQHGTQESRLLEFAEIWLRLSMLQGPDSAVAARDLIRRMLRKANVKVDLEPAPDHAGPLQFVPVTTSPQLRTGTRRLKLRWRDHEPAYVTLSPVLLPVGPDDSPAFDTVFQLQPFVAMARARFPECPLWDSYQEVLNTILSDPQIGTPPSEVRGIDSLARLAAEGHSFWLRAQPWFEDPEVPAGPDDAALVASIATLTRILFQRHPELADKLPLPVDPVTLKPRWNVLAGRDDALDRPHSREADAIELDWDFSKPPGELVHFTKVAGKGATAPRYRVRMGAGPQLDWLSPWIDLASHHPPAKDSPLSSLANTLVSLPGLAISSSDASSQSPPEVVARERFEAACRDFILNCDNQASEWFHQTMTGIVKGDRESPDERWLSTLLQHGRISCFPPVEAAVAGGAATATFRTREPWMDLSFNDSVPCGHLIPEAHNRFAVRPEHARAVVSLGPQRPGSPLELASRLLEQCKPWPALAAAALPLAERMIDQAFGSEPGDPLELTRDFRTALASAKEGGNSESLTLVERTFRAWCASVGTELLPAENLEVIEVTRTRQHLPVRFDASPRGTLRVLRYGMARMDAGGNRAVLAEPDLFRSAGAEPPGFATLRQTLVAAGQKADGFLRKLDEWPSAAVERRLERSAVQLYAELWSPEGTFPEIAPVRESLEKVLSENWKIVRFDPHRTVEFPEEWFENVARETIVRGIVRTLIRPGLRAGQQLKLKAIVVAE